MRLRSGLVLLLALVGCATDAHVSGLAIRDPLGLVEDVYGSGHELRLYVLPGDPYGCNASSGTLTTDVPDLEPGMFGDAIVDVSLAQADTAGRDVQVPPGSWTVLVRGKGTDRVSGEMNVFIATGCQTVAVENGATVEVPIVLVPVVSMGTCGNSILSPDEQCEGGPNCTDCRTTPESLNTTTTGPQQRVRVAARSGQRTVALWNDLGLRPAGISLRLFDPDARPLTGMGPLEFDEDLDGAGVMLASVQTDASVAVAPDGRIAIAFADLSMSGSTMSDVRVAFFSQSRTVQGASQLLRTDNAGAQGVPAVAISGSGATMVVFEDAQSSTGLSGRVIPTGTTMPAGGEAFEVGAGRTGASAPAIAGTASGFVVAFAAAGDVFYQRFSADGEPSDASAQPIADPGGARSVPAVGAAGDDSFLVAWAEDNADGMGSGVRGRVVNAAGTPVDDPFTVNTTLAGDQTRPAVAGSSAAFVVAFESAGSVRARGFTSAGVPSLNHERPPTLDDFEVAATASQPAAAVVGSGATQTWWIAYQAPGADADEVFARRFPL